MTPAGAVCQSEWSSLRPAVFMSVLHTMCCSFSDAGFSQCGVKSTNWWTAI